MLIETVKKYGNKEVYNLNCAETILYAANEEYELGLDHKALKTIAAFGGGMGVESVCGAISGALAALGVLYVKEKAHESTRIKELSKEFIQKFKTELGTDNCAILKQNFRTEEAGCSKMTHAAATILDEIVKREGK